MPKPTPRADVVNAVAAAVLIVEEAIPVNGGMKPESITRLVALQAAALPVIVRELLDVEIADEPPPYDYPKATFGGF